MEIVSRASINRAFFIWVLKDTSAEITKKLPFATAFFRNGLMAFLFSLNYKFQGLLAVRIMYPATVKAWFQTGYINGDDVCPGWPILLH